MHYVRSQLLRHWSKTTRRCVKLNPNMPTTSQYAQTLAKTDSGHFAPPPLRNVLLTTGQ